MYGQIRALAEEALKRCGLVVALVLRLRIWFEQER